MTPLLLSTALALAPAAAPPAAAPPAAAPAPAAAVSMAPAPAPAPAVAGPVAAPTAVAPAPAPAAVAPAPAGAVATSTTTVAPAGTNVTVNVYAPPAPAPVVATTPVAPTPAPVVVAPAVVAPTVAKPDPAMVQHSMRRFRRGAVGLVAIGAVGMGVTMALQGARLSELNACARRSRGVRLDEISYDDDYGCYGLGESETLGSVYGALGLATFVTGIGGAGSLLGKAAAHRDVQLNHGTVRRRAGLKLLGAAAIVGASVWMVGSNWTLLAKEGQCGTAACQMRYRPLRYAANDAGALGLAAGSAMVAYGVSYEKQGRALMRLRAAPTLTRTTAGVSLSGKF